MATLVYLNFIAATNHTVVEPGAIVITDKNSFFVSVSTGEFVVEGEQYTGVSLSSPLYQAMKGLAKGDHFMCRGIAYKIMEIL
jgi:hypothetical protein